MKEYKITKQRVEGDWAAVEGAAARQIDLHPPSADEWTLHSFEHAASEVVAVWWREKRHGMSDVYSHAEEVQPAVKTIADMPEP